MKDHNSWLEESVSEAIRLRRQAINISQGELSRRSGIHRSYISAMERGVINVSLKTLQHIAEGLEVSPSELMMFAEQKQSSAPTRNAQSTLV